MRHFFLYYPYTGGLDDLVLGENCLIAGLYLFAAFLCLVSTVFLQGYIHTRQCRT